MKLFKQRKVHEGLSIIVNIMINNLAKILAEKFNNRLFSTLDIIYRNIIPINVIAIVVQKNILCDLFIIIYYLNAKKSLN